MLNSLNVAQSGLSAAQTAVENVMNNIANENTPGYKKRNVNLTELAHNDSRIVGRGVFVDSVNREISNYMYNNLVDESTKESYLQKLSGMLEGVESLFKETDESGFSADLNRYFQSIENLRSNPGSTVYSNDVKTQGTIIVDSLQRLYEGIEKQEEIAKESLEDDIKTINGILQDIGKINEQLGQEIEASNDLLDRRDLLEEELSKYIDIDVDRLSDDYELKIGGVTAVRHSTNVREVTLEEVYTPQKDRYVNEDGKSSSVLNGLTFDNNDVITFKLDNAAEVSVMFGESVTLDYDIDGDTVNDTIVVDETNYVRALAYKINNSTDFIGRVEAYNGDYALDENGDRQTINSYDNYLMIEAKVPGREGKFESSISFIEQSSTEVKVTDPGPLTLDSITPDKKIELNPGPQQNLVHTVNLTGNSVTDTEYDFSIVEDSAVNGLNGTVPNANFDTGTDYDGVTFTNGVTYNATTGKITVPAGVIEFDIEFPVAYNAGGAVDATYNINVGTQTAVGTIQDELSTIEIVSITSASVQESSIGTPILEHDVNLSGPMAPGSTFTLDLTNISGEPNISLADDIGTISVQYYDISGNPVGVAQTIPTTGVMPLSSTLTLPAGNDTASFKVSIPITDDSAGEFSEKYNLQVTNDAVPTNIVSETGEILDDDIGTSKLILKNDYQSTESKNELGISVYDKLIPINSGSMRAQIENLNSDSSTSLFQQYKDELDAFAQTLSDVSDKYMRNEDGTYIYGEKAIDDISNIDKDAVSNNIFELGLFSGSDVSTLKFNELAVNDLDQNDLDYLATLQFKNDIYFNGKPQGSEFGDYEDENKTTFSDYFQSVRVGISSNKENTDFLKDTQEAVKQSIQNSYDQVTKVDRDEEMLDLIKFQAAYTANAKVVTVVDEMLNTLLGLKS